MKNKLIWPLVIIAFTRCEKVIEPKSLPQQDPMLVLNCILYNDSAVKATVCKSKSILSGKDYVYLDNAACDLYENDHFTERLVNVKNGNYSGVTIPQSGKKYTMKVAVPGYNSVEGSTVLGDPVRLTYIERYDTVNSTFHQSSSSPDQGTFISGNVMLRMRIADNITETNYYSLDALVSVFDTSGNEMPAGAYIQSNIPGNTGNYYYGNSLEIDDEVLVNSKEVPLDVSIGFSGNFPFQSYNKASVYLRISEISEDLYKYRKTLMNQAGTGASLFAEPVMVHNNIQNGVGIMGSINTNTVFAGNFHISR